MSKPSRWIAYGNRSERRKVLYSGFSKAGAESNADKLARHHKASMTVTQVDGRWVVFRARNRA